MIGIDIVEIDKISKIIERWSDRFLHRVFTDRELKEWGMRGKRTSLLAGKFATKEAFFKANKVWQAMNLFHSSPARWKEIEVLGAPPVIWFKGQKMDTELSISHTQQFAVSVVLVHECV